MEYNKPINRINLGEEKLLTLRKINEIIDRLNELEVKLDNHTNENLVHMKIMRGDMGANLINTMNVDDEQ